MTAKLEEIFDLYKNEFDTMSKSILDTSTSYEFETKFNILLKKFGQSLFQGMIGRVPKSKNEQTTVLTSMGNVCFPKNHPFATAPGGFKISPYMQEHLCRVGTKMVFEEASEELALLMGM